jgi:F0F1-type ATP synthase assembly protein I
MSTLIAGFAVWGAIGWLLDQWWGTRLATPIGLLIGMALGIYAVVARHGRPAPVDRTVGSSYISTAARRADVAAASGEVHVERAAGTLPGSGVRKETARR